MADVDEDGVPDLLALSRAELGEISNTGVSVALGDGAGGFADPAVYRPSDGLQGSPTPLGVADIDGDGHADVYGGFSGNAAVYVLRGQGDGSFGLPSVSDSGAASVPTVVAADIDVDGHLDLVTDRRWCSATVPGASSNPTTSWAAARW